MCWACMPPSPEAPVVKVMLGCESQCVRVLVPDDNVGHRGFHDVLLFDMTDADTPHVAVNDLSALWHLWPTLVISGMTQRQLEWEQLRRTCNTKYSRSPTGLCRFCKVIKLDLFRHVANYYLELA